MILCGNIRSMTREISMLTILGVRVGLGKHVVVANPLYFPRYFKDMLSFAT
jgi:hypothetical protein